MPLADAFVANDAALKSITESTQPSRDLAGVDVKSIDVVKLAQLHALMTGKPFKEALQEFLPEALAVSDDGPWVYKCPLTLQKSLASLSEPETTQLAERWSKIREFELDRIDATRVLSILLAFVRLSKLAVSSGDHVFLWNCL
jgi:hypothetical protein